jgi:hypothetical protein
VNNPATARLLIQVNSHLHCLLLYHRDDLLLILQCTPRDNQHYVQVHSPQGNLLFIQAHNLPHVPPLNRRIDLPLDHLLIQVDNLL